MEITKDVLAAIIDAYPYELIFADRTHTARLMNAAARRRYAGRVEVGASLFGCHNEHSRAKIEEFLAAADAGDTTEKFEVLNTRHAEREFFVPVVDAGGKVIGYFERHETVWSTDDPSQPLGDYWERSL